MRDFEISSREFTTAERKRILPATMTQLQKICSLLNILTFRRSTMTEEQLEENAAESLLDRMMNGSKLNREKQLAALGAGAMFHQMMNDSEGEEQLQARAAKAALRHMMNGSEFNRLGNPSLCALTEAEDQLAQWRFKRYVDEEMKRIESVIDDELKRIEGLNREVSPHEQCYGCKVNLSNTLALAKKIGRENLEGSTTAFHENLHASFCCGKRFCHICNYDYFSTLENKIIKCPICHGRTARGKLPTFKALLKLADQKIPW